MEKLLKAINCVIKDFNDNERSFLAVASDESIDRDGDRIMAAGWDVGNFLKNPVIPWAHNYSEPPVARAVEIGVKDGRLEFRPQFPPEGDYPKADTIWRLYKGGYLKAFSVGFMPKRWDYVERAKGQRGRDYHEQELWEISACTVPSNPNALVAAKSAGIIDDQELQQMSHAESTENAEAGIERESSRQETVDSRQEEDRDSTLHALCSTLSSKLDAVLAALAERPVPVAQPQPQPASEDPSIVNSQSSIGNSSQTPTPEALKTAIESAITDIERRVAEAVESRLNFYLGKV